MSPLDNGRDWYRPKTSAVVAALDAIPDGDPEGAHGRADAILLASVPDDVREAYRRVVDRNPWWAMG